jgi:pantoate--beta-alanine ligase
MQTIKTKTAVRSTVAHWKQQRERVAFVPTMGNLHDGHLKLVQVARQRADRVLVSVFVNPMQFGQNEDIEAYPRTLEQDSANLAEHETDVLFVPDVHEIYPQSTQGTTRVEVPGLSDILCGASRPGHFVGVTTVVAKLFNIVQPDLAVFGEKDFQQLRIIQQMVADLDMPIEVIGVPTVREDSGLAMSSRNNYLSAQEREQAAQIYKTLQKVEQMLLKEHPDLKNIEENAVKILENAGLRPDYVSIRRKSDLREPVTTDHELVVLAAAWLGRARLIDNLSVNISATN